jgi:hypothetical protein
MGLENDIKNMNRFLENREFKFKGKLLYGSSHMPNSDIDFKFKIVGTRKMISVGNYYDYLVVEVTLIRLHDRLSQLFFSPDGDSVGDIVKMSLDSFYYELNNYISSILRPFGDEYRVKIDEINLDLK